MPPRMVGRLPLRIDNRSLTNFDDAVARGETDAPRRCHHVNVSPLQSVVVDVVGYLAKQNTFRLKDPVCLRCKPRIRVGEVVTVFVRLI